MNKLTRRDFLNLSGKYTLLGLSAASGVSAMLSGCVTSDEVGIPDLGSIIRASKAVAKTFEDITPEQEYYIGRTIGAVILDKYKPYDDKKATMYVNTLGQTLAQASDLPETFGGYHFLIQDSMRSTHWPHPAGSFLSPGGF